MTNLRKKSRGNSRYPNKSDPHSHTKTTPSSHSDKNPLEVRETYGWRALIVLGSPGEITKKWSQIIILQLLPGSKLPLTTEICKRVILRIPKKPTCYFRSCKQYIQKYKHLRIVRNGVVVVGALFSKWRSINWFWGKFNLKFLNLKKHGLPFFLSIQWEIIFQTSIFGFNLKKHGEFLGGGCIWISLLFTTGVFLDRLLGGYFKFGHRRVVWRKDFRGSKGPNLQNPFPMGDERLPSYMGIHNKPLCQDPY